MTPDQDEQQPPRPPCVPCCQGDCHMCTSAACGCHGPRHISRYPKRTAER